MSWRISEWLKSNLTNKEPKSITVVNAFWASAMEEMKMLPTFMSQALFESRSPTRDFSVGCAWGHTAQEEMVVRMSEAETSSAVLSEIKFTEIHDFLESFEIWIR
jgi:hypothetical protein